jgi:hypothetical protein
MLARMRGNRFHHPARLAPPPAAAFEGDTTQAEIFAELGSALAAFLGVALLASLFARLLGAA